ncbi:DUF1684 domain-containing protein [Enterovirga aerilata]|uniref:DUF1684 domain-containing protein n=1 Tax=Enterovirga aerilata TaxID=2730920 RepID=A0A849II61_9HYPH|nr:DUF1684 domain-containing protein [Enterovirga sp. DB1703]NNM73623.1 DUF1684 domain-containing protein [Enterovirga sp. DB1703]
MAEDGGGPATCASPADTLALWDWRRRIADLYGEVRRSEPRAGWGLWRASRDALLRDHPQSPLPAAGRAAFSGLPLFPYDPALRFEVGTEPVGGVPAILVELRDDGPLALTPFARTLGLREALGGELTLYWIGGYGGGVFLPFRDATSGRQSYGGGRYLLDTIKGADLGQAGNGRVILDFNFAYNPSCAYSDRWACPLSPAENGLPAPVRTGEMMGKRD